MKNLFLLLVLLLSLSSCLDKPETHLINGHTMGTTYSIKIVDRIKADRLKAIQSRVDKRLVAINQSMSTYIKDSEINSLNNLKSNISFKMSDELSFVMKEAWDIAKKTKGAFDPTVGRLVNRWGFGPVEKKDPPNQDEIELIKKEIGYEKLIWIDSKTVKKSNDELFVDLSAIAKGYGVDIISELLWRMGLKHTMVEIGGEIKTRGFNSEGKSWRLGVESPKKTRSVLKVVALSNMSIASSGNYRNFYQINGRNFSHTIDPRTGQPVKSGVLGSSIINHSCMRADAWATALMVLGEEGLRVAQENGVAALIINEVKQSINIVKNSSMGVFINDNGTN